MFVIRNVKKRANIFVQIYLHIVNSAFQRQCFMNNAYGLYAVMNIEASDSENVEFTS